MLDSGVRGCLKVDYTICSWINWKPAIEFGNPILECVYRNNTENMPCRGVTKEDVDERNDLESFSQAHGVGKNAAKSSGGWEARLRLHNVVVEKTDPTNLHRGKMRQGNMMLPSSPPSASPSTNRLVRRPRGRRKKKRFSSSMWEGYEAISPPTSFNYHYAIFRVQSSPRLT